MAQPRTTTPKSDSAAPLPARPPRAKPSGPRRAQSRPPAANPLEPDLDALRAQLIATVREHYPQADLEPIGAAFDLAVSAHAGQPRATGEPYVTHPIASAQITAELGIDPVAVQAALLHDVPEDTEYSLSDLEERFGADVAFGRTVGPLASVCKPAIGEATKQLTGSGARVLDLGAGAAPWSLALAEADPQVTVTAVDLPAVLPVTRQAVAAAGREGQFHLVENDIFRVALDDDAFDLVILGNICHLFDESTNRRLLGRVANWVAPGGTVAIIDFVPNERRDGPRLVTLFGAELVGRVPSGQLYPFSSYAGWLRESGFERIDRTELSANPPITLVRARLA